MKNSNLFIKLTCLIPALLLAGMVNLKAQNYLNGYMYLGQRPGNDQSMHYYYLSNCATTWEEANTAANEMGGYLATLTDVEENVWLAEIVEYVFNGNFREMVWIGLRGENGIYEWTNGETSGFENWAPSEPVYADGAALIEFSPFNFDWGSYLYYWTTHPVNDELFHIVEFPYQPNCNNNPNKTYVCHNGNTICVSVSALQSHLNHGCLEGPCGPCNINAMQASPGKVEASEDHAHHGLDKSHSEQHEDHESVHGRKLSNQIQIYPNPASEQIQILLPEGILKGTLRILSVTGQEMHKLTLSEQQSITLDLSSYYQGLYLIEVQSITGRYQKTFVKL